VTAVSGGNTNADPTVEPAALAAEPASTDDRLLAAAKRLATPAAPERSATMTGRRRPRLAYLSFSTGVFDARSIRMARSAVAAGYEVTIYARWEPGLRPIEEGVGYRVVRVPADWRYLVPGLRGPSIRRAEKAMATAMARPPIGSPGPGPARSPEPIDGSGDAAGPIPASQRDLSRPGAAPARSAGVRPVGRRARFGRPVLGVPLISNLVAAADRLQRVVKAFPLRPLGWALALDRVIEPADVWHGMWAGSLPALARMRRRHGGATIYDSRDVYMLSRDLARLRAPFRSILGALERRWARAADRVLTVNEPYADLLATQLGIRPPAIVMNCPEPRSATDPVPDLLRSALGLPPDIDIILYQGQLISERGIEQAMDAILEVPSAVLVLLGYGPWEGRYRAMASAPPYEGRVLLLPAVQPGELLDWTASADVMVMPIQPTTINHRFSTPQKLLEAVAAGVPVVASDLPGMADIVTEADAGELCDPTSPAQIAAAMRRILASTPEERSARRTRILGVAHHRLNWASQAETLLGIYRELVAVRDDDPAHDAEPAARP
jgi:glycosyltransferase involved in cell wall biosynthesis